MPIINGEKWACQSCIKGHRVSGCQHTERELTHINPKGRPVKQCEHCRNARKNKSHHAKCDCGPEKRDKNGNCGCRIDPSKCTCGKDKKPKRLASTRSDTGLTLFNSGIHKPSHRMNNSAHLSGAPYKIPRSHAGNASPTPSYYAPDSPYGDSIPYSSYSNRASPESMPMTPVSGPIDIEAARIEFQRYLYSSPAPTSACASPIDTTHGDLNSPAWPWANHMGPGTPYGGYDSVAHSPSADSMPCMDSEWPPVTSGPDPLWSTADLPLDPNKLGHSITRPMSHSGESTHFSAPGLTTSSCAQSEIGEAPHFGDFDYTKIVRPATADQFLWDDVHSFTESPAYRVSSAPMQPHELRQAPTSVPSSDGPSCQPLNLDLNNLQASGFVQVQHDSINSAPRSVPMPSTPEMGNGMGWTSMPQQTGMVSAVTEAYSPIPMDAQSFQPPTWIN